MSEPWVDVVARRLAGTRSRREVVKWLLGLLVGGLASGRGRTAGASLQEGCRSSSETYCRDPSGALVCIDLSTDSENCGYCGRVCPDLSQCADFTCTGSVDGQPPAGLLSASAQCVGGPRTALGDELLDVVVSNNTGHPVTVVHIGSLTGPAQPGFPSFELAPGEGWQGLLPRTVPDGIAQHGAIVTTDVGVLVLPCGDTDIPFGTQPADADDPEEKAAIMARTLSILETSSSPSFDGLHTLLHPGARELASYSQLACWYWNYVQTERPAGEATVTAVRIAPWTWGGNGTRYEGAAEVTYRQPFYAGEPIGGPPATEDREATIHLVQHDGIWRWFFGTDPEWLAQLPEVC